MIDHMRLSSVRFLQFLGRKRMIRVADLVLCVYLSTLCSGCLALAVGAAGGAAGAVYVMGKLKDEFNRPLPVVHDAAVAGMKDLELNLSEDKADKTSAHMESAFSDGARVWIDLESISDSRCRITIRVGLTGDEVRSRKIYDAIKQHLPRSQTGGVE
jgi:hypothetical protein